MGCAGCHSVSDSRCRDEHSSEELEWIDLLESIPMTVYKKDTAKRNELWKQCNESDGYITFEALNKMVLGNFKISKKMEENKIIRKSFETAKVKGKELINPNDQKEGDFLKKNEFRLFFVCLRQYLEYFIMFVMMDKNKDFLISFEEFKNMVPVMNHWGANIKNEEEAFANFDTSKDRRIDYDEFCSYAFSQALDYDGCNDLENFRIGASEAC